MHPCAVWTHSSAEGPHLEPSTAPAGSLTAFRALLRGLCPVCRRAPIFAGRWRMNDPCPVCGTTFERVPGWFVGAMYISYAIATGVLLVLDVLYELGAFGSLPLPLLVLLGLVGYAFLIAPIFRWSRILWIWFGERFLPPQG